METKYIILQSNDPAKLAMEVQAKMAEGWRPQGGVAIANASAIMYTQAMVI